MNDRLHTADRVVLLLSLVSYLQENGPTTITELAERFEVKPDMLRTLVRFLGMAGVPGETQTYQHEDLFDLDWDALEQHDTVSLTRVVAVDDTPRFSAVESASLIAGLSALVGIMPAEQRENILAIAKKLSGATVEAAPSSHQSLTLTADIEDPRLATVIEAAREGRRLHFTYTAQNGAVSERSVDPLGVFADAGTWYLRAYCLDRAGERTFRLDGMREVAASDVEQVPPRVAADQDPVSAGTPFGAIPADVPVRLAVREGELRLLAGFSPDVLGPADQGWVEARVMLGDASQAPRLVQLAPGAVRVLSPESARTAVARWAEAALAGYEG